MDLLDGPTPHSVDSPALAVCLTAHHLAVAYAEGAIAATTKGADSWQAEGTDTVV